MTKKTARDYREIIRLYDAEFKSWRDRGTEIVKRYRDDAKGVSAGSAKRVWSEKRYNILWSNTQTLSPALFARVPKAVCERKWKEKDPVAKLAAEIAEAVGICLSEQPCYEKTIKACVDDLLLPGRGVPWIRYEKTDGEPILGDDGQPALDENGNPIPSILDEKVLCEYVPWDGFGHDLAITFDKTAIRYRVVEFDKDQAERRFPGKKIAFDKVEKNQTEAKKETEGKKVDIVELWDKTEKRVVWFQVNGDGEDFLDDQSDILGLENFFPCPEPLFATMTNGSLVPVADYCFYQEQAEQLDLAIHRRQLLISAIRVAGVYNGAHPELKSLLKDAAENELIAVKGFVDFAQAGGISGQVDFLPIEPMVKVLQILNTQIEALKEEIYEITGISDIIRGHTSPSETATAQQMKGQFATLRLEPRQRKVQVLARDLLRLMVELAVEQFSDEKIAAIFNLQAKKPEEQEMFGAALQLLRDDKQRQYRIDIETDSMIALDEDLERQRRTEAVGTFVGFLKEVTISIQQMPQLAPVWAEMMMFQVRSFRGGRQLENVIEQQMQALVEQAMQPPPEQGPPPPDPMMVKAEQDGQLKAQELELRARQQMFEEQVKQVQLQLESRAMVIKETEIALKIEAEKSKAQLETDRLLSEIASGGMPEQMVTPKAPETQAPQSPIALTINMPGQSAKKRVMLSTDPLTGMKVGQIQDEPEVGI